MDKTLCRFICAAAVLAVLGCYGKVARAIPTCPPLCALPPDPAPPMPPVNFPDPPFSTVAPSNPNHNHGTPISVVGTVQAGAECRSGNLSGTVVMEGGKSKCNFTPSTLPVGGACHANKKIGSVTVVDGKRYCRIAP